MGTLGTYSVSFDVPINDLAGFWVHSDCAGAINDTIRDDGLRVDTGEGLGGFVGQDRSFGGHVDIGFEGLVG